MELNMSSVVILVSLSLLGALILFALSRRLRAQSRAARRLPERTDRTVRAEQDPEVHDRATQAAEPASPPTRDNSRAPAAEEVLKRFNPD